jgi:phosphodiesterase/alkaline phosphatase D-like protein
MLRTRFPFGRTAAATLGAALTGFALLAAGCSDAGTDPAPPADTGIPTAGTASGVTDSSFSATWSAVTGATGYRIDVAQDSLFGAFLPGYENRDAGTATSLAISGLVAGQRYFYRVRAVTASGVSANSNVVGVTLRTTTAQVSFSQDVRPLLVEFGCTGCHGGTSGLTVGSVASLLQGGNHGPAIIPGDGANSILVRKISPGPPFGNRMPQGGPFMPEANIATIRTWIDQGALNN